MHENRIKMWVGIGAFVVGGAATANAGTPDGDAAQARVQAPAVTVNRAAEPFVPPLTFTPRTLTAIQIAQGGEGGESGESGALSHDAAEARDLLKSQGALRGNGKAGDKAALAKAAAGLSAADAARGLVEAMKYAAHEYEDSLKDGKFVNADDYRKARGIVLVSQDFVGAAGEMKEHDSNSWKAISAQLNKLAADLTSMEPPASPALTTSEMYGALARIELAAGNYAKSGALGQGGEGGESGEGGEKAH